MITEEDLKSLENLPEGWDGYRGKKVTREALKTASALCIVPTNSGGVQIELHSGDSIVEIEIDEHGYVHGVSLERAR